MLKKILSFVISLSLCLSFIPGVVSYADYETDNYYISGFSSAEQAIYEKVQAAVINCQKSITLNGVSADRQEILGRIGDTLLFYDPYTWNLETLDYTSQGQNVTLHFTYLVDYNSFAAMQTELDGVVEDVLTETRDLSVLKKLYYIHDYIIKNCDYDLDAIYSGSPYGALVDGKAKCDGYSLALQMIAEKAGIPCVTVISLPQNGEFGHAWNKVKVSTSWYNIDLSSDDTTLKSDWDEICYDWFLLADSELGKLHKEWDDPFITEPKANNKRNSYYEIKKLSAKSVAEAKEMIKSQLDAMDFTRRNLAYVAVEISDKEVLSDFITEYKAGKILTAGVVPRSGKASAFINPERQVVHIKITF
jgi:hypothetical protein